MDCCSDGAGALSFTTLAQALPRRTHALALPVPHKDFSGLGPADSLRCPAWSFRIRFGKASGTTLHACKGCWRTGSSLAATRSRVCEAFGFGLGRLQRAGCLKALAEFEAAGRISLPSPTRGGARRPRRLAAPVPPPKSVPEDVGAVEGLELVPVLSAEHRGVWNTMLEEEHPRGAGPLVGCQLRCGVGAWLAGGCRVRGVGVQA